MKKEKTAVSKIQDQHQFHIIAMIIMSLIAIYCVVPFFLMLSVSFSSEASLTKFGYQFFPREFSSAAYEYLWAKRFTIFRAYGMTILVTVVGTISNLAITSLFAYPLSRRDFRPRNFFAFLIFFSIMFNGGLTSTYIIWTQLFHIKNTIWALLLPGGLMSAMNVLLVRNYYSASIPFEIVEAARIDGANEFKIFARIMLPLSKPVLATIGLFASIGYWNNWTNGLYYISDAKLYTIQVFLKKLMDNIEYLKTSSDMQEAAGLAMQSLPSEGARMAIAIIALLPILMVYPLVQKQMIKGLVVGGVKG